MSAVVKAVVGVVAIVVGVVYDQPWLVKAGTTLLLASAAQALGPKPPRAPPLSGIGIAYSGTLEPRRIVYGTMKLSGLHCLPPLTSGANNDYFHEVLALAGHPVDGFGDIYLGQIRIPSANIAAVTGSSGDGLVSGIPAPPAGTVNGHAYNSLCWLRRYDGTQTSVDFILNSTFAAWDSNHVGQGIANLALQFKYDQNVFGGGAPQVTVVMRGKRVYDPRLDSTNGGSGSQRYATPSTWTFSTNPALCLRDFLTASIGLGEAQTNIDDVLVAAAASKCDEQVTVPIPALTGLVNWTNGSSQVVGVNTQFLAVLSSGMYVLAPNGSMLQIGSVLDDVHFTLSAGAYGGSSAANQVLRYNPQNVSSQTMTQSRYTCNTALDATARYEDNIATLAAAMRGHALLSGGKWRMYAGGWSGSAFTLTESDLVGAVTVQASTPRKDLFNSVRGNFLDPSMNYQPNEFPPVTNSTFVTQDGETLWTETSFPCCSDRFEAQRNAIIMIRQSRDRRVVIAQYGLSAFGVKVYETGTVTIAEVGWVAQTVRCTGWKFTPHGVVELTLQEAYSADFTDPNPATDYSVTAAQLAGLTQSYLPYAPTALVATSVPGGINFSVTLPSQLVPGTRVRIYEYTASTPFSSASIVLDGNQAVFFLAKGDQVTRYYWATTVAPNGLESSTSYPSGAGVAGVALPQDTAQLAANASSQVASATSSGLQTLLLPVSGVQQDLDAVSVAYTSTGAPTGIDVTGDVAMVHTNFASPASGLITVRRDGSDVGTAQFDVYQAWNAMHSASQWWRGQVTLTVDDTPGAGSHTYTLHMKGTGAGTSGNVNFQINNAAIKVREYKR